MQDFRNINACCKSPRGQKAHELTLQVYRVTKDFPKAEFFSLTSQIRRACYSIPMNLAEGCAKSSDAEFGRFIDISCGSASELDYGLLLARDLNYLSGDRYEDLLEDLTIVRKMLSKLRSTVKANSQRPTAVFPIANS
jgi:four helix bundle protein